jgi:DNA-binding CsgD family transcriptional regulator
MMTVKLTQRQFDVLSNYAETGLQKETALQMGLSLQTVKNHLRRSYRKIGATNITEAYRMLGWLNVPGDPDVK